MKSLKKIIAVVLSVLVVCLGFTACSNSSNADKTDSEKIKEKGELVVGITDFAPMDYKDENGNWIGFDADLATKTAEKLGVKVKFVVIDWDNKFLERREAHASILIFPRTGQGRPFLPPEFLLLENR